MTHFRTLFLALASFAFATSAFAIDQVTLTNGQVVQGKVLNDVPNRYVDIELINGNTKRFEHNEVASVDRDVPNRVKDREMYGNDSSGFFTLLAGGAYQFNSQSNSNNVLFDYGVKVGLNTAQMGDFARLGFALAYDRTSRSYLTNVGNVTSAYNDLNFQVLFMRISNSGLYFGPNIGLALYTGSADSPLVNTDSTSYFEAGVGIGYEAFLSSSFSIGPDVRFEHVFASTSPTPNFLKFTLAGNFHF